MKAEAGLVYASLCNCGWGAQASRQLFNKPGLVCGQRRIGGRGRPHADGAADQVPPHAVLGELQPEGLLMFDIFMFRDGVAAALCCAEEEDKREYGML